MFIGTRWFIRPALVILLVCGVVGVLLYVRQPEIATLLTDWEVVPQLEPLTELYFNSYLDFPKQVTKGQSITFSFTVHNLEGKTMTYPYDVYLQPRNHSIHIPIEHNTLTLQDTESRSINESYTFKTKSTQVVVYVELPSIGEKIHFALPSTH